MQSRRRQEITLSSLHLLWGEKEAEDGGMETGGRALFLLTSFLLKLQLPFHEVFFSAAGAMLWQKADSSLDTIFGIEGAARQVCLQRKREHTCEKDYLKKKRASCDDTHNHGHTHSFVLLSSDTTRTVAA